MAHAHLEILSALSQCTYSGKTWWGATALPGVEDTPWHSKPAALCPAVSPCLPFRLFVCLQGVKRLLSSAAVASPTMEKAPLAPAAWRCPVLCHLPITPCVGQCWWGQQLGTAVCLVLAVVVADGDSRGEKGENVRCDVLRSVAVLWYPAHTGASNSLWYAALVRVFWCSGVLSPPGSSW